VRIEKPCSICGCEHPHEYSCVILEDGEFDQEYSQAWDLNKIKPIKNIHVFRGGKEIMTTNLHTGCRYCWNGKEPDDPVCPTCKRFLDD